MYRMIPTQGISNMKQYQPDFPRSWKRRTATAKLGINIAKKHMISFAQLSLAFVNQQPFVTSNIIGATTIKQLKEDIESVNIALSSEIIDEINLVHKNNPNPTSYQETKRLLNRFPSHLLTATKLILKGDWNELNYKLNKMIITPIKNFIKKNLHG